MKRIFDIILSILGLAVFWPALLTIALLILLKDGRPVLYIAPRMKTVSHSFNLLKFRTMTNADTSNSGVTGGDKSGRITTLGHSLRKYRLDELPQLFNVLKGDISFVGPRPPLRRYTVMFPELYEDVLRSKPGITGLATLTFHAHEERLLTQAKTAAETENIYIRRCIPRKARLDLIYQRHQSVGFDMVILWRTVMRVLGR